MHPLVVYDIQHLEHAQHLAEAGQRRNVLQRLLDRTTGADAARAGRGAGRPSASSSSPNPTDFVRVS
jgi:hypothetical protein